MRLGFAETWQETCDIGADNRVFDVNVNNVLALDGLDVYVETKECNYGLVKEISVVTSEGGAILLDFYALFGEAFLSSIQVLTQSSSLNETAMPVETTAMTATTVSLAEMSTAMPTMATSPTA